MKVVGLTLLVNFLWTPIVMYTTLSPCDMCSGAILLYKIPMVVIGENRTFRGPEEYLKSRGVRLKVLNDKVCVDLMNEFIKRNPGDWTEDIGEMTLPMS